MHADSNTVEIPLTHGAIAIIDVEDASDICPHRWYLTKQGYAARHCRGTRGKITLMHRQILGLKDGMRGDHIDRNKLNNRRSNLRQATHSQNLHNAGPDKRNTSGYKGVSRNKSRNRWDAHITVDRKRRYLGGFRNIEDAARSYDVAAKELLGEFAYANFPEG